jgi:Ser/Thr protein kinase RdoA (MazF antagonist)
MEREIRDRFNERVLGEAMARYGIAERDIELLDGFESFMYEFRREGKGGRVRETGPSVEEFGPSVGEYILRLGHSRRRTPDLIRGEVDWINFLAGGGAGVARAIVSQNGNLVEVIPDNKDGAFLASAFVKARGGHVWDRGGWNDAWIDSYGRLLGRIHALSKEYRVADEAWRRPNWEDDQYSMDLPLEPALAEKLDEVMAHLLALPVDREGYGMIHQDAHAGNFFVDDDGRITLFDFDDCVYGHFAYDLAMVLFYAVTNRKDAAEFAADFWPKFMAGYYQENDLDAAWQKEIPHFMKLREIDLYAMLMRDYELVKGDQWIESFLDGRRERIAAGRLYLEMDF